MAIFTAVSAVIAVFGLNIQRRIGVTAPVPAE
jgi:hypothetical protein